jgi:hypothetical protein
MSAYSLLLFYTVATDIADVNKSQPIATVFSLV